MILAGCTATTYTGAVAGVVQSIHQTEGKCPTWEVTMSTSSRVGSIVVKSDSKPDYMIGGSYALKWTATSQVFECTKYSLDFNY